MKKICTACSEIKDSQMISVLAKEFDIKFPEDLIDFFILNNGGIPETQNITIAGREYEVRCFLSFNSNEYNSIALPMKSFQDETKGKIYPIAKDSADNYYCINKETGKVYYWDKDDNLYYCLSDSFSDFLKFFS